MSLSSEHTDIDFPAGCPEGCKFCDNMLILATISSHLEIRGLDTSLDACDSETPEGHYDSVIVTNSKEPQRGSFHLDADGESTWHRMVGDLLDPLLLDEISNVLRLNGLPKRVKM